MSEYIWTDDLQVCKSLGERRYELMEANAINDGDDGYCISEPMVIDINDWHERKGVYTDEAKSVISSYYGGTWDGKFHDPVESFENLYQHPEDRDQILAEMIYECTSQFMNDYGAVTEEQAVNILKHYMETGEFLDVEED